MIKVIKILFFLFSSATILLSQSWKPVTELSGGDISLLSATPDGRLFCSSANRIFTSNNGGVNWTEYYPNVFINQPISAFGFIKDDLWLIGAGETIFRSIDKGLKWELIDSLSLDNVRCFVHLRGDSILAGTDRNLLLSTDNGIVWNVVPSWKVGATNIFKTDTRIFVTAFSGLFESTYDLNNWDKTTLGKDGPQINGLFFHRGNSIYAYVQETSKIYYTTNGGNLWLFSSLIIPWTISGNPYIAFDGSHYVLTKQRGLCKSTNAGFFWERADSGLLTIALKSIFLETSDALYFSDGLRIYKSSDSGRYWSQCNNGIAALDINTLLFNGENLFIGTNQNGFFRSFNRGQSWVTCGYELDTMDVISLSTEPSSGIYAGTHFDGVMYSSNYGTSFVKKDSGFTHSQNPNIYSLACDSSGEFKRIYSGTLGLYYLQSNQWEKYLYDSLYLTDVYDIRFGRNSGEIYLATDNGIFYSIDYGENWHIISLWKKLITSILIDNLDMYAGTWSSDGVLYSSDDGYTWEIRNKGLPEFSMIKNIIGDNNGTIYTATLNSGIYMSKDKGLSWSALNKGLPTGDMGLVGLSPWGTLYAATRGWGLFEYDPTVEVKEIKVKREVALYPNPATDCIEITLFDIILSDAGEPDIRIYNVLGMEESTPSDLTPDPFPMGDGSIVLVDISSLSPGVYFVRIGDKVSKFIKF